MSTQIENIPAIEGLNQFAAKLAPEHRQELYRTVEGFMDIGVMNGIFSALISPEISPADKQADYKAYLQKKAAEAIAP